MNDYRLRIFNVVFVPCNELLMKIMTAIRLAGRPNSSLECHPSLTNLFGRRMKPHTRASVTQNYRLLNPLHIKTDVLVAVVLVIIIII